MREDSESTIVSEVKGINDILTPKAREAILTSGANLEQTLNAAFAPFEVEFIKGATFSQMVKRSPQYRALADQKSRQSGFMNKVKSTAKALYLGEQTLEEVKSLEASINEAFEPYMVIFTPGKSLPQMVKESPIYQKLTDARDRSRFFNEVKSKVKALDELLTVEVVFLMRLVSIDTVTPSEQNRRPVNAVMGMEMPRASIDTTTPRIPNRGPVYTVMGMEKPRGVPQGLWATFKQQGFAWGTMRPCGVSGNVWHKIVNEILKYNRRLGVVPKFGDPMKAWAHERELMRWHQSDVASRQQKKAK